MATLGLSGLWNWVLSAYWYSLLARDGRLYSCLEAAQGAPENVSTVRIQGCY